MTGKKKLVDEGGTEKSSEEKREREGSSIDNSIVEMVKTGAISLEENDSKDFLKLLTSTLQANSTKKDDSDQDTAE